MGGSMVDIQSATAENIRGKKKERRRNKKPHIYWSALFLKAAIINWTAASNDRFKV